VPSDCGLGLVPTHTFADCPPLDLICVPGGAEGVIAAAGDRETIEFVRRQAAQAKYVTSVCTGAFILGAAGLLRGRRATTHWAFTGLLPLVGATYEKARIVKDGNLVTAGGVTKEMDGTGVSYVATFPTEAAGPFVIAFMRGAADTSAPSTTVNLPAPFALTLPARELSRATDDLTFNWAPTSGTGDIDESVAGSCVDLILETIPDDGTATISRDQLHTSPGGSGDSCTVTVSLARAQSGQPDPAFTEGGSVTASQLRSGRFTSKP